MTVLGVLFIVAQVAFFTGVAASPDHVFRGYPAAVSFFGMCATGLALAVHAL